MRECPSCGRPNPERARFCVSCGAPLPEPERRDAERKPVTVLFCDLVGFTARSDLADPEDVKATLRPFHARIVRELENHGGTLDKFIGDAVVGVFGAPVSHEDDPERAVRAAFRILQAIEELNEENPELGLAARIGIDTGEAVVALGPGPQVGERVTGEVVARAGLLQAAAPVGGIAVGEATHRATRDLFAHEEGAPAEMPGRGAVPTWRPIALSRLVRERPRTPFVGRGEEAALLRGAYRRAVGGPSVQLVTVTGEPGIGKTRLLQELAEDLDRESDIIRWRVGRCRPYGEGVAFAPLADVVKAEAGILDSDPPEEARGKVGRALEIVVPDRTERDWLRARLEPLLGLGDPAAADRAESFTAWRRTLEAMAAQHATIVVLEDLHWADPALLDFVEHVVDRSSGLPLLLLCAARPELFERRPAWGGGTRNATSIWLRPLSETETSMLVAALLDPSALEASTRSALLERSGGNPLYAEEFARMLAERDGRGGEIPVPGSVHALIAARLDTLPAESKSLLQDAATFGRTFWAGALAEVGNCPQPMVGERLHALARQELVRPVRTSSIAGEDEYEFWHALVRDVAYEQVPKAERGARHRAAAAWLARVAGERIGDQAEVLAHHYGLAVELAGERVDDGLRADAARAHHLAAQRARRLDADAAERHLRLALELLPPGHPDRGRVLVSAAESASTLGRYGDARRLFEEARDELRALGDTVALGDAMVRQSRMAATLPEIRRSEGLLDEAIAMLQAEPAGPELARAYTRKAGAALLGSRWAESLAWADKALELAQRLDLPEEIVRARQYRGAARSELGDPEGLADQWASLRLGTELGLGEETVIAYGNLGVQLWLRDGPVIALQAYTSAMDFAETRGFRTEAMWMRASQLEALFDLGRWDELLAIADEIVAFDREEGGGQLRTFAEIYRGFVLVHRGDVETARLLAEEYLPRVRILPRPELVAPGLVAGAVTEAARGHGAMAERLIRELAELTEEAPDSRWHFLPFALRTLVAVGRTEGLEALLHEVPPKNLRHTIGRASALALLAETSGRLREAAEAFDAAAAAWRSYGSVLELAHARVGQARCALALGEHEVARGALEEARARFGSVGAVAELAAVDVLLAAV